MGSPIDRWKLHENTWTDTVKKSERHLVEIFGDRAYRESIYEGQDEFPVATDLDSLLAVSIEFDEVIGAVAKVFGVDSVVIVEKQTGRRSDNAARRIAIYCAKRLGGFSQREVAVCFGLSHTGSVSSAAVSYTHLTLPTILLV